MTPEQEVQLLSLLERFVSIAERWYAVTYPPDQPVEEAIIHDPRTPPTDPASLEEYQSLPSDGPGRFQLLIERAKAK